MRNRAEVYDRADTVPPAFMFNFLRAAYGSRNAETIFRSYGLSRPGTNFRCVQKSMAAL
jgi:hypothetical protein